MNFTPQQIKERYKILPQELKDIYFSEETAEKLTAIGKANNLRTDQIGLLADETGLVMLGLTSTSEYITNLAKRLEIDKELAKKTAEEVNSQIFSQVREAMKKVHGIPEEKTPKEQQPPAPTSFPKTTESMWKITPLIHPQNKIFEEKIKNESHRSSIETVEKTALPTVPLNLPVATTPAQENIKKDPEKPLVPPKYPEGVDPYREPLN